jgi:hypothetical protein
MAMPHAVPARTFTHAATAGRSAGPPGDLARAAGPARIAMPQGFCPRGWMGDPSPLVALGLPVG